MFYKLRWLREVGIFLITTSILFLPFFRQVGPNELVMGKSSVGGSIGLSSLGSPIQV